MNNKQSNVKLRYLFSGIFAVVVGVLAVLSIFLHCETSLHDYEQTKTITRHTPYIYCALAVFGICAFVALCMMLGRIFSKAQSPEKISKGIFIGCGIVVLAAGVFWICFSDSVPTSDQRTIYEEARKIAGFLDEPYNAEYFSYFPRNRGIVLLVAFVMKVFGDHLYSFQIINIMASIVTYASVCKSIKLVYKNPVVTSMTSILLMLFYPLFIYDIFYYGTLLSVAFASMGLCATIAWCETGLLRHGILIAVAFPMGILMHQSAAIGLIASIIYLIMNGRGRTLLRNIFISAVAIVFLVLFTKIINTTYIHIAGENPDIYAVPAACTIYMGVTADTGNAGPGSQDASEIHLFSQNNTAQDASRDAMQRLAVVTWEYLTGKRSLGFFVEKAEYQWLDPTFGARKIIKMNDPNMGDPLNGEAFVSFYKSSFRSYVFKLSIGGMLLVYVCALITGVKTICDIKAYPAAILIQLYVIGGFAFQLLWESLSRYCLGYFVWLIPEAAFGLYCMYCFAVKHGDIFRFRAK